MSTKLYCPIREQYVADLPEERVRQRLLACMLHQLGYPKALIAVEKALAQMPHLQLQAGKMPDRRADILCFAKGIQSHLFPLLLVECKAIPLTPKVINQVVGYNHFVQARYLAIANQTEVRTGWFDVQTNAYKFGEGLPAYQTLNEATSRG